MCTNPRIFFPRLDTRSRCRDHAESRVFLLTDTRETIHFKNRFFQKKKKGIVYSLRIEWIEKFSLWTKRVCIAGNAITLLEVIGFPDVHAHQGHELQLRQPLPGGRRQGQQIPEVRDFRVDQIPPQLTRPFGRLGRVEPVKQNKKFIYILQH